MSVEKVRAYLEPYGVTDRIREFDVSSATVELAALAVGVEGARIAKTLSFKVGEDPILTWLPVTPRWTTANISTSSAPRPRC